MIEQTWEPLALPEERPFVMTREKDDTGRLHGKKTTTKFKIKTNKCFPARVPIPILEGLAPGRGRTTPAHRTAGSAAPLGVSPAPRLPEQQGRARSLRTEMEEATLEGESSAGPWGKDWGKQRGDGGNLARLAIKRVRQQRCQHPASPFQRSHGVRAWRSESPTRAHYDEVMCTR